MNHGLSDQVRSVAEAKYIEPAIRNGQPKISIAVRDLMRHLEPLGFPARNWPQICTAIQAEKFLRANGLEIESVDGPPKKQSSTVIVHYRVASAGIDLYLTGDTQLFKLDVPGIQFIADFNSPIL